MASERAKLQNKFMLDFQRHTGIDFIDDEEVPFGKRARHELQHIQDLIAEAVYGLERQLYELEEKEARHGG